MPSATEYLGELLTTERAALRLYEELAEATCLTTVQACRRSHERRAMFLSGQLRRRGTVLDPAPPPAMLYGLALSSVPSDRLILLAALLNAERRGKQVYDDAYRRHRLDKPVAQQLRSEQAHVVQLLETTLAGRRGARVSMTRPIAGAQPSTMAANRAS